MRLPRLSTLLAAAAVLAACDSEPGGSLYDPDTTSEAAPAIASVSPQGVVLAGIDEITITGQNFSATPDENLVFFNDGVGAAARGTVLAASETELRVRVPNLPNDALKLRVAVQGAPDFSNEVAYPLTPAFVPFGDLDAGISEEVFGLAPDGAGGLYVGLGVNGGAVGIQRFAADGSRSEYLASTFFWSGLDRSASGDVFGARRVFATFQIPEGGPAVPFGIVSNRVILSRVAFGPNGDLYAGGTNRTPADALLYRIRPDEAITTLPFPEVVRDLAVGDGALFVATAAGSVWRIPLEADGALGTPVVYVDLSEGLDLFAVAVAADGTLFLGTDGDDPILEVAPGGTSITPLYPGVLSPPASGFAWGEGSELFVASASRVVSEIPFPAALVKLETRRQGPSNG